ncbi:Histone H1oo Oocyte-specific histone H1 Oocyte-specific linker histone H1 [Channa argus]|uniref:Histone H1oo Oocyte-specific histone H1 Oocyte-specific linker histone H1 n=1 Tax=Channa argus TaxID=215402 RepID=A0A6G1PI16_CHAAH|nr:Histone H1oo Oocyte-specific histone H1 Oocyte-specific linker histone H1 [Channa argus]
MPPKKPAADPADPPALPSNDAPVADTAEKKTDAASLRKLASHPSTAIMMKEALKELDSRNGVSSHAIQNYIKQKYPTVDVIRLKYLVSRAIKRGLENGTLVRPAKSSEAAGLNGKFRLSPKNRQMLKTENMDPNAQKGSKPVKDEAKKPKKAGVTKKRDPKEQTESQEDSKPPKKPKKGEGAAISKRAPGKKTKSKTDAEKDVEEASGSTKTKPAKATKTAKAASKATGKQGKKTA